MSRDVHRRVAIACQGGGSHTAFTAGVLQGLLTDLPDDVQVVALTGTSGGALCATLYLAMSLPLSQLARRLEARWKAATAS